MYRIYAKIAGANVVFAKEKNYKVTVKEIIKKVSKKTKIIFLANPNNPTGTYLNKLELINLRKKLNQRILLVLDDAYFEYMKNKDYKSSLEIFKKKNNVIILRTFSKAFGVPSIRTGFTISSEENMDIISKMRPAHEMNSVSIAIAEYLLDNIDMVMNYCEKIKNSRNLILKDLKNLGLNVRGQHGNYILITFKSEEIAKNLVKFLKEELIYVKGPYLKPWNMCICFTVGPQEYMKKFLSRMLEAKKEKIF